jgi:hypothetical protein
MIRVFVKQHLQLPQLAATSLEARAYLQTQGMPHTGVAAWLIRAMKVHPYSARQRVYLTHGDTIPTTASLQTRPSTTAALNLIGVLVAGCNDFAALALGAVGASVTTPTPAPGPVAAPTPTPTATAALPAPSRVSASRPALTAPFLAGASLHARHGQKGMR